MGPHAACLGNSILEANPSAVISTAVRSQSGLAPTVKLGLIDELPFAAKTRYG